MSGRAAPADPTDFNTRTEIQSMLDSYLVDYAAFYVSRGRAHANLSTIDVEDRWVNAFRVWLGESTATTLRAMEDYRAELSLRGKDPPYERVVMEFELLRRRVAAGENDPEACARVQAAIKGYVDARNRPAN